MQSNHVGKQPEIAASLPTSGVIVRLRTTNCWRVPPPAPKRRKLRSRAELRDRIELLECARERVGETPCRPGCEFFDLWIEIQIMNPAGEMFGNIQLAFDESPVDDQFRGLVRKSRGLPRLDLLPHRLEVPLHAVHSDREDIHEAHVFGVLREHRREGPSNNVSKSSGWNLTSVSFDFHLKRIITVDSA